MKKISGKERKKIKRALGEVVGVFNGDYTRIRPGEPIDRRSLPQELLVIADHYRDGRDSIYGIVALQRTSDGYKVLPYWLVWHDDLGQSGEKGQDADFKAAALAADVAVEFRCYDLDGTYEATVREVE